MRGKQVATGRKNYEMFDSGILRVHFPEIELFQLSAGTFQGWIETFQTESCRVAVGNFNQSVLCEGNYNPGVTHLGFILDPGLSAVVEGHEYDDGTLVMHRDGIVLHEVFPRDLVWVDIAIADSCLSKIISSSAMDQLEGISQALLKGSRESMQPLVDWVNRPLGKSSQAPDELELSNLLSALLIPRLTNSDLAQNFTNGDRFRVHLLDKIHHLKRNNKGKVKTLTEICESVGMKPRTLQKYFKETYGMGPIDYFKVRRLNNARAQFQRGESSVTQVAHSNKFTHLGRFSVHYKALFGESPTTTIKRASHSAH